MRVSMEQDETMTVESILPQEAADAVFLDENCFYPDQPLPVGGIAPCSEFQKLFRARPLARGEFRYRRQRVLDALAEIRILEWTEAFSL